jgi:hypothetical protein
MNERKKERKKPKKQSSREICEACKSKINVSKLKMTKEGRRVGRKELLQYSFILFSSNMVILESKNTNICMLCQKISCKVSVLH